MFNTRNVWSLRLSVSAGSDRTGFNPLSTDKYEYLSVNHWRSLIPRQYGPPKGRLKTYELKCLISQETWFLNTRETECTRLQLVGHDTIQCGIHGHMRLNDVTTHYTSTAMYTRVNKNPSAWNFLSHKPEVTCGTVAVIILVVLLSPYLRIRAVSLSSIQYNQSHRVYINRRRQYICLIWN